MFLIEAIKSWVIFKIMLSYLTSRRRCLHFNHVLFVDVDEIRGLFGDKAGKAAKRAGKIFLVLIIIVGICLLLFQLLIRINRGFEYILISISLITSIYVLKTAINVNSSKL